MSNENLNHLHSTTDATVWAKEFCKNWPTALSQVEGREGVESEEGFEQIMVGWFANAIMAGVDSVPRAPAWQDISTLPSEYEDGRELLVADVDDEVHHVCWDNEFENWWPIRGHRPLEVDEVFFWMPLYKPPQSGEGE